MVALLMNQPAIIESADSIEIWATGGTILDMGDHIVCVVYSDREIRGVIRRYEVARIMMPCSAYQASYEAERARQGGGQRH